MEKMVEVVDPVTGELREVPDDPRRRREYPSPTQLEPPVGFRKQPSMWEVMREMIRREKLEAALAAEGFETPEEADDFDVPDDSDPVDRRTPYEHNFDPPARAEVVQEEVQKVEKVKRPKSASKPPERASEADEAGGAEPPEKEE